MPDARPNEEFAIPIQDNETSTATEEQKCEAEQSKEAEVDALTEEIAEAIRNLHNEQTNPDNSELGAFILRLINSEGETTFVRTGIGRSHRSRAIGLADLYSLAERNFPGIDGSNVIRVVHLHPAGTPDDPPQFRNVPDISHLNDIDFGNTMPSHPNTTVGDNDWVNTENFLRDRGLQSTNNLSHSILGPDGVLREFDYSDGHPTERSAQVKDAINAAELDAAGVCK